MKPVNECLNERLSSLCEKALMLESLQSKVLPLLPDNLKEVCKVSGFNNSCLNLVTTDAVWASQIRFLIPELRDKLRNAGLYQLSSIKINIEAPEQKKQSINHKYSSYISNGTRDLIVRESEHCTYEPLKKALENLAKC